MGNTTSITTCPRNFEGILGIMEADDVFEASLLCQLPGHALTKHEVANFGQSVHTYFPARDLCLQLWRKAPGQFLAFSQCVEEAKHRAVSMRDLLQAFKFLNSNGYINAGVPVVGDAMPKDDKLVFTANAVLRDSNLDVCFHQFARGAGT